MKMSTNKASSHKVDKASSLRIIPHRSTPHNNEFQMEMNRHRKIETQSLIISDFQSQSSNWYTYSFLMWICCYFNYFVYKIDVVWVGLIVSFLFIGVNEMSGFKVIIQLGCYKINMEWQLKRRKRIIHARNLYNGLRKKPIIKKKLLPLLSIKIS